MLPDKLETCSCGGFATAIHRFESSSAACKGSGISGRGADGFNLGSPELFAAEGGPAGAATPSRHRSLGGVDDADPGGTEGQAHLTTTLQTQVLGHTTSFLSSREKGYRGCPSSAKSAQDGASSYSLQQF
jgi:hypothetical protein